jgi:hypothetical protein
MVNIAVSIKGGFPPEKQAIARDNESDHVNDFFKAAMALQGAGNDVERQLKLITWPTKDLCESRSRASIQSLAVSIGRQYAEWSERWDGIFGKHFHW